jgi:predicted GNAT family N-acyltransferase
MTRPSYFGYNPETAKTNLFQKNVRDHDISEIHAEFEQAQQRLSDKNINLITFDQPKGSASKDAIFPNNWFTTHHDGSIVVYPLCHLSRRDEIDISGLKKLDQYGFLCRRLTDLRGYEQKDKFLEGTGSMVFDHIDGVSYMTPGPRSDADLLHEVSAMLGYDPVTLKCIGSPPVYHTNVMMMIGNRFYVVCEEVIEKSVALKEFYSAMERTNREPIKITLTQMRSFCANMLELQTPDGPVLAISETAVKAFNRNQIRVLEKHTELCAVSVPLIEQAGGGSIRCMLAEVFLPEILGRKENFVIVTPSGNISEEYFRVRWECLRKPWGQPKGSEIGDDEEISTHFCIYSLTDNAVIGCGRLHDISSDTVQFRYMAVMEKYRGKGLGRLLISAMEEFAHRNGYHNVTLQARENAVNFYESVGYRVQNKTYILFDTIQHYRMVKQLK